MPTVSETYIENRQRVQPTHTNNYASAHGGNVVKWMDEVGAMSAMRHAGETCVTARINGLDFERPIPQGETCVIESYVYEAGRTSVRVRLRAYREVRERANGNEPPIRTSSSSQSTRTSSRRRCRRSPSGRSGASASVRKRWRTNPSGDRDGRTARLQIGRSFLPAGAESRRV